MNDIEIKHPKFIVGNIVASDKFAGEIKSAFFSEGEWCYSIGENASLEPQKDEDGEKYYRIGPKYVRESDIKWKQNTFMGEWRAV